MGFEYAMRSGTTLAVADITIPPEARSILAEAQKQVEVVERDFRRGLLTEQEQNERVIEIWQQTTDVVARRGARSTWTRTATSRPWQAPARRKAVSPPFRSWPACAV